MAETQLSSQCRSYLDSSLTYRRLAAERLIHGLLRTELVFSGHARRARQARPLSYRSIRVPSSTTRSGGRPKWSIALLALRARKATSDSTMGGSRPPLPAM